VIPFTDLTVANNNYYRGRDGRVIDTILCHTMVGTWQSANSRFNDPAAQVSAHRGICFDGIQRRWVEDEFTAYHAGDWEINLRSLGIEGEDMGKYNDPRPDVFYSMYGAVVAEMKSDHPAINLDRYHVVPGLCRHGDVHATACPDGLDTDRIIWIARRIIGGTPVTTPFDPRANPADLQFLDDRYANKADVAGTINKMKLTYDPVAAWAGMAPKPPVGATLGTAVEAAAPREPATHMKGTPPVGHDAHETKAGIHKAGKED